MERKPTKRIFDKFGREKVVKISALCQRCPNEDCEGWYRVDAPRACHTFRSWKEGRINLKEAARAKRKQHERHERTDAVRNRIYGLLKNQCHDYEDRRMAGSVASEIVKGTPIKEALRWTPFYLNKRTRDKIRNINKKRGR